MIQLPIVMKHIRPQIMVLFPVAIVSALLLGPGSTCYAAQPSRPTAPAISAGQGRVDVNSADAKALEALPGVGPVLAQRIISGRPYVSYTDLERVKGLGKSKVASLRDRISFGPAGIAPAAKTPLQGSAKAAPTFSGAPNVTRTATARPGKQKGAESQDSRPGTNSAPTQVKAGKLAPGERININRATEEELQRLPGIGPAKAKAIAEYRSQHGEFKTLESLQQIKGIKEGVFSRIKDSVSLQ